MGALGFQELLLITFIVCFIAITPYVFYLLELQKTLSAVKPENRKMHPGLVWHLFIPIFSTYWYYKVVTRIADSLAAEFEERKMEVDEQRPGLKMGMALFIIGVIQLLQNFYSKYFAFSGMGQPTASLKITMFLITFILGSTSFVLFIMYWIKIKGYRNMLNQVK